LLIGKLNIKEESNLLAENRRGIFHQQRNSLFPVLEEFSSQSIEKKLGFHLKVRIKGFFLENILPQFSSQLKEKS